MASMIFSSPMVSRPSRVKSMKSCAARLRARSFGVTIPMGSRGISFEGVIVGARVGELWSRGFCGFERTDSTRRSRYQSGTDRFRPWPCSKSLGRKAETLVESLRHRGSAWSSFCLGIDCFRSDSIQCDCSVITWGGTIGRNALLCAVFWAYSPRYARSFCPTLPLRKAHPLRSALRS